MTTKTITVTEEAYEALARHKKKDESFSELALRLTRRKGSLEECWGLWKLGSEELKVFEELKRSWAQSDSELKKRLARLE
jgi:predicted CopG family antitoxin